MNRVGFIGTSILLVLMLLGATMFVVDQRQYGVVYQMGQIQRVVTDPGLNFKLPLIQNVNYMDKRLLTLDSTDTEPMLTAEKQPVVIDWYVRWRITDPQEYIRNVGQDEKAGAQRLNSVVRNALQEEINRRTVREIISTKREGLMADVKREVSEAVKGAKPWGIEIVDVRIMRADLPQENSEAVYHRMRTEREREVDLQVAGVAAAARAQLEQRTRRRVGRVEQQRPVRVRLLEVVRR